MRFLGYWSVIMSCVCLTAARAQTAVAHLGKVDFATSCSPQVRDSFNKGVALLHSFQYDLSRTTFAAVARQDPHCAMAYWGRAMSLFHPLWAWPDAQTLQQGHADIDTAEHLDAQTDRERAYIRAAAIFYEQDSAISTAARVVAYSAAMATLHEQYPADNNASALYALSLIAVRSPDKAANLSRRMNAIGILNDLYRKDPENPGVPHYLIHATDTPELAHLGLTAAQRYAAVAPDAPHALHMPSHIFTELGMWSESIRSNLASVAVAERNTRSQADNESGDAIHALGFLQYAYLQTGRDSAARHIIDQIRTVPGASTDEVSTNESMLEAAYAEETHDWKRASTLVPRPNDFPMIPMLVYAVRAIGEAHTGDTADARTDIDKLHDAVRAMVAAMKGMSMMGGAPNSGETSGELEAEAWLALAVGKPDEALAKMQAAADRGGESMRMGGLPGVPAREVLGDLLLELKRPAEALAAYQSVLKVSPNRFDSLYGAARAAQLAGDVATAKQYFGQLEHMTGPDADRVELRAGMS